MTGRELANLLHNKTIIFSINDQSFFATIAACFSKIRAGFRAEGVTSGTPAATNVDMSRSPQRVETKTNSVPARPGRRKERFATALFLALSPRLPKASQPDPPEELAPFEKLAIPRRNGGGDSLTATWFPASRPVGAVLLLHPWMVWGKAYFHLRGRLQALRAAGYHALTFDFAGFGGSGSPAGFFDRDVEDALGFLRQRAGSLPIHVWGVSAGGYWAHPVLARTSGVAGAMFEDVSPHLLEWSWRRAPLLRPAFLFYRFILRAAYRFLDVRKHARVMSLKAVTYVSGALDRGVRPEDTQSLAEAAGGRFHVVHGADHLGSIKVDGSEVLFLAIETFMKAEKRSSSGSEAALDDSRIELAPVVS
jgi:pimeloyl-ACP methyl ester carboxylesterase